MEKVYILKMSNKEGKEIFKNRKAVKVKYGERIVNMVGDICSKKLEEVMFCSSLTEKPLAYGAIVSNEFIVNDNTAKSFIIVK